MDKDAKHCKRERLVHIDIMVGITMMLVVLGHFAVGIEPDWYRNVMWQWIYSFHMQLFVFLSAFIIRYSYKEVHSIGDYGRYVLRKVIKFVPWYFVLGVAIAVLKRSMDGIALDVHFFVKTLHSLALYPRHSEAAFLWYIYILLGYYIISPLFFRLPGWAKVICCVGAMLLPHFPAGHLLCAYDFCQYTFFYCLGVLCAEWIVELVSIKRWAWALMSMPFVVFSYWLITNCDAYGLEIKQLGWWLIVSGVAALPFFYLLALTIGRVRWLSNVWSAVSKSCYWIYLLQMFIIWGCVWLVMHFHIVGKFPFVAFLLVSSTLAIVLPMALRWIVLQLMHKKRDSFKSSPAKNTSLK
ncbi:MAG: acyltransferase [Bacteroidales bacterium]|nr:acyltransferase [Bacteroidales bacterium]